MPKKTNGAPPAERRIFRLHTVEEVIRALDGPTAAGRLVGKSRQSMCNAIRPYNRLPRDSYVVLARELLLRGYTASPKLWGLLDEPAND